jgi:hypothetical protein
MALAGPGWVNTQYPSGTCATRAVVAAIALANFLQMPLR